MDSAGTQCTVLGSRCFVGDLRTASEKIIERVRSGRGGYVCQANAHVLVTSCHDGSLRRALEQSWTINPDGWPVAWAARRLGAASAERIAGADLMTSVFELGEPLGLTHYLFGSTPDVIQRLVTALVSAHKRARIIGAVSPPFGELFEQEAHEAIERIRSVQPDVVWCGLGAPKQELWMNRYASVLAPAVLIGVGAAFDFHAGTKTRAPAWMQRNGLEWAHRLWSEPRRLTGRYVRTNTEFLVRAAVEIASTRRSV
jgi:N-acetylglucosaminyldiphosphoundecaprenol N-acetyl-beta-D-mannosaminyltransferase